MKKLHKESEEIRRNTQTRQVASVQSKALTAVHRAVFVMQFMQVYAGLPSFSQGGR